MQLKKQMIPRILGILIALLMISISYFNQSIFMEQILICVFIIGLVVMVSVLGKTEKSHQSQSPVEENIQKLS